MVTLKITFSDKINISINIIFEYRNSNKFDSRFKNVYPYLEKALIYEITVNFYF